MTAAPSERMQGLVDAGQAPWLDSISRDWLESGELERLRDRYALRGVTSNPSIFQAALKGSTRYDADIERMDAAGASDRETFHEVATSDIRRACDVFAEVHRETGDGYVSIELDPDLAHDPRASHIQARDLWARIDRPNLMIKVPATDECIPLVGELIDEGINVNVTLLFDVEVAARVRESWLSGLYARHGRGEDVSRVASVASFFVSRVDTLVDRLLAERRAQDDLRGRAAVANAVLAWDDARSLEEDLRWKTLVAEGARPQRLLWASTGTKDPGYSDVLYVDELVAAGTVNTLPLKTIEAFADHGTPAVRIDASAVPAAKATFAALAVAGIDMSAVTAQLRTEGVAAFVASFDDLVAGIAAKRGALAR